MSVIDALLSARLFLIPQLVDETIYFVSNLSGHMSLYRMPVGGGEHEPLLPPEIALQNPKLVQGSLFVHFAQLDQTLVLIDQNGDEAYQPHLVTAGGGTPQPAFGDKLASYNISIVEFDLEQNLVYLLAQARDRPLYVLYQGDVAKRTLTQIHESMFGGFPLAVSADHRAFILGEFAGVGDIVAYYKELGATKARLVAGTPLSQRTPDMQIMPNGLGRMTFVENETAVVTTTTLFDDRGGFAYLPLDGTSEPQPIAVVGVQHSGDGQLEGVDYLEHERLLLEYNIDGVSWVYEARLDVPQRTICVEHLLIGQADFADGVVEAISYSRDQDCYILVFSTATSPTQIYTIGGPNRDQITRHTNERIVGVDPEHLSSGESYPFTSHDGLRISARLYLPAESLGFQPPFPLVYYIHGGPQGQERPDFAWFSMPLIQQLTLRGFAVFVPNVRGSTGYGLQYTLHVQRDWGGQDRLDHVHAMTEVLPKDDRIDTTRAGVTGRSYGGYMTLTLAFRHPQLWQAAVDMFGPYNLLTFAERVPATWKPFIKVTLGDPESEQPFLLERSPSTYAANLACPLLVIQGANDPRVLMAESQELIADLTDQGKRAELLLFEDEGHDILKYDNRVNCYNAIVDWFSEHLAPGQ